MSACVGIVGAVFGHRFRGRWAEVREIGAGWTNTKVTARGGAAFELLDRLSDNRRTYHGDICERCGTWREVPKP